MVAHTTILNDSTAQADVKSPTKQTEQPTITREQLDAITPRGWAALAQIYQLAQQRYNESIEAQRDESGAA